MILLLPLSIRLYIFHWSNNWTGLRDDGTYLICYRGWNVDFHYDDKEILYASISEEGPYLIRFGSSPFPTFGKHIEIVKEYLLEKHGIRDFR